MPRTTIPDPGFAGDDGQASAAVRAALAGYAADPDGQYLPALAVLQDARVLVPVVATAGKVEIGEDGLARDKTSDMAAVLMRGRDGRTALLAFTSMAALRTWRADARPVPVSVRDAARAALGDDAEALLVDVAGPTLLVVSAADVRALATGRRLARAAGPSGASWSWSPPTRFRTR